MYEAYDGNPSGIPLDRAPGAGSHCDLFCCFCDATHLAPTLQHAAWRGNALSEEQILAQLREVEVSLVRDQNTKRHFVIPSAANRTKIRLYKALGLSIQRQTVPVESDA